MASTIWSSQSRCVRSSTRWSRVLFCSNWSQTTSLWSISFRLPTVWTTRYRSACRATSRGTSHKVCRHQNRWRKVSVCFASRYPLKSANLRSLTFLINRLCSSHINYGLECLKAYSEIMCSADDKTKLVKTKMHNNLAPFDQLYAEKCGKNFVPADMRSEFLFLI